MKNEPEPPNRHSCCGLIQHGREACLGCPAKLRKIFVLKDTHEKKKRRNRRKDDEIIKNISIRLAELEHAMEKVKLALSNLTGDGR